MCSTCVDLDQFESRHGLRLEYPVCDFCLKAIKGSDELAYAADWKAHYRCVPAPLRYPDSPEDMISVETGEAS